MSKDTYLYPGTQVLINKLDIRDGKRLAQAENDLSFQRAAELLKNPIPGQFDYDHLKRIHGHLFQDVYEWAGEPRTIAIYKAERLLDGRSIPYPIPNDPFPPDNLQDRADYAFQELKKDNHLQGLEKNKYIDKLSHHMAEIWEVHPFRDGNTRAVTAFMMQLSKEAGHPFEGKFGNQPGEARDAFVLASEGNREPLKALIAKGLGYQANIAQEVNELKARDPEAYGQLQDLEATAKQYAGLITTDQESQDKIANRSVQRAYQNYQNGQAVPDVSQLEQGRAKPGPGYDPER